MHRTRQFHSPQSCRERWRIRNCNLHLEEHSQVAPRKSFSSCNSVDCSFGLIHEFDASLEYSSHKCWHECYWQKGNLRWNHNLWQQNFSLREACIVLASCDHDLFGGFRLSEPLSLPEFQALLSEDPGHSVLLPEDWIDYRQWKEH